MNAKKKTKKKTQWNDSPLSLFKVMQWVGESIYFTPLKRENTDKMTVKDAVALTLHKRT